MTPTIRSSPSRMEESSWGRAHSCWLSVARVALRAPVALQDLLARADRVRRDLDQLVLIDPLHGGLDREQLGWREDHVLVAAGGADVGQLLLAGGVHVEVIGAVVLADDHAFVDRDAGADE